MFTLTDLLTLRFCVLCAKVARIQHLCFADKLYLQGPGQQRCCSLHWIRRQDLPITFWVYVCNGASISTLSVNLPLLCALKQLWLLKCSI